jgi:hypothetical protein|uniref:DUF2784 family protein n=1 Tax=viral metagenome TaxID=1070528 RepID=A0A6C0ITP1_9ZZZZ
MLTNNFNIKLIKTIHLLLILYVTVIPFILPQQLKHIIPILCFILYRWFTGDHSCTLTTIENKLTGNSGGFIYRIVNPIYQMGESKFNRKLYLITILWLVALIYWYLTFQNYLDVRS